MDKLTSGPGSIILPLAVAGASMAMPRVGQGLSAGLGVLDWARRNTKAEDERKAFATLPGYFSGGAGAAPGGPTTAALAGGEGGQPPTPTPSGPAPTHDFGAALDAAMRDPVNQKSPEVMSRLLSIKAQMSLAEPHRQVVPNEGGGSSLLTIPRLGGTPTTQPLPGVGRQTFGQGLEDELFGLFGRRAYTPGEVQQAQGSMQQRILDTETRKDARSWDMLFKRDELSQNRAINAAKDAEVRANLQAGRQDYNLITGRLRGDEERVNAEARRAITGLGRLPGDPNDPRTRFGAAVQGINDQRDEALQPIYQDFQRSMGDFRNKYPDHPITKGGTPDYVQGKLDRFDSLGNVTDDALMKDMSPADAASFQKAMESNINNPAMRKKIRQDALRMKRR